MTDSYFQDLAGTNGDYYYVDSSTRRVVQWPLALSWPATSGSTDPSVLYNDNPAEFFVYSGGLNTTAVFINRVERIGSVSVNLLSGSGVQLGVLVGESLNDPLPNFYGSPYTTSGTSGFDELYFATEYLEAPADYLQYLVTLPSPGNYNIVFPRAVVNNAFTVVHSGLGEYTISQVLPRRSTGTFDLEVNAIKAYHVSADLINTIALQVSDSIVVSPDIPDKSITGDKILDGTVSGVLITPGTITSNEIAANTITAFNLNVDQLDAVAANMGNLVINSGISIADNGYIWAGTGTATSPDSGLKIYSDGASSKLTAYGDGLPQLEISASGSLFTYPSGFVTLNREGLTLTTTFSGTAPLSSSFNGFFGLKDPLTTEVETEGILKYKGAQGQLSSILYTADIPNEGLYTAFQTGIVDNTLYPQKSTTDLITAGHQSSVLLQASTPSGFATISLTASGETSQASHFANTSAFYGAVYYNAATDPIFTLGNQFGYGTEFSQFSPATPDLGEIAGTVQVDSQFFGYPKKSFVFTRRDFSFEQLALVSINGEEMAVNVPIQLASTVSGLPPQPNLLSNGNFINNSSAGYGALPDDWFQDNFTELLGGGFITADYSGIKELDNNFELRANWYLNESSGNAVDYSGTSKTATQTGTVPRSQKSPMAYSPTFDATANYFTYTDSGQVMNNSNGFVMSAVVQVTSAPTSGGNQQSFCGFYDTNNNETSFGVQGNSGYSYFYFQLKLPSGQGVITVTHPHLVQLGKWYHIVAQYVKDPGVNRLVLWVNGTKAYVDNGATGRSATTSNVFGIGCAGNGNQLFSGRVNALTWWSDKSVNYLSTKAVRQMFAKLIYSGLKVVPLAEVDAMIFQDASFKNLDNFRGKYIRFSAEVYLENSSNSAYCSIETNTETITGDATSTTGEWVQISTVSYIDPSETSIRFAVNFTGPSSSIWVRRCYAMVVGERAGDYNLMGQTGSARYIAGYDHAKEDWQRFPSLLTLDYPIYHNIPYLFEENRWYSLDTTNHQISGGTSAIITSTVFSWAGNKVSYASELLQLTSNQTYFWVFPPIRHSTVVSMYSAAHCNVVIGGTAQADIGLVRFTTTNEYWVLYPRFNLLSWSSSGAKAVRIPFFTYMCDMIEEVE